MYAKEVKGRFFAVTEDFFREKNYKITKSKFYKSLGDFRIDVVVTSFEPTYRFLESGHELIAKPQLEFRLIFPAKFCSNLGIFTWNRALQQVEADQVISSIITSKCPIHNEEWKIADIADFDRYRVGIRMRCLEYIEKSESFLEPKVHFRFVFGSKGEKPKPIGGFDARKVALFRLGQKYGINDPEFVWGIETWIDRTREAYKKLVYWANTPQKPLPPGVTILAPPGYDPFAEYEKQIALGNKHLRILARALDVDTESWTMRCPITQQFS